MTRELAKIWYRNECWSCEKEEIPLTASVVSLATGMMLRSLEGGEIRDDYLGVGNSTFSQLSTSMLQAFFPSMDQMVHFKENIPIEGKLPLIDSQVFTTPELHPSIKPFIHGLKTQPKAKSLMDTKR